MRVGIVGAGQLSRMLILAGIPLGIEFVVFNPQKKCCVSQMAQVITASFEDQQAMQKFRNSVDVITYENENITIDQLKAIAQDKLVCPNRDVLTTMQDRLKEKTLFNQLNIPTNTYYPVDSKSALEAALDNITLPVVLKQRTNGYDGKGQIILRTKKDVMKLTDSDCVNTLIEEYVAFDREVSIIAARSEQGEMRYYDICENRHENGILHSTKNRIDDACFSEAKKHITTIMNYFSYVGVCTVEFFEKERHLLANEVAPRVHNSGHWTIEGAQTSQFENHLRCIVGWSIGDTHSVDEFEMHNILGAINQKTKMLRTPGLYFHDYAKTPAPQRKVGHVNVRARKAVDISSLLVDHL